LSEEERQEIRLEKKEKTFIHRYKKEENEEGREEKEEGVLMFLFSSFLVCLFCVP